MKKKPDAAPSPEPRGRDQTPSGLPLRTSYPTAERPGEPPFTRGIHPDMYRGRLWTFRQYAGFGSAAETNARFRYLLGQGQTGLSMAFDLPTQIGYDSDHPLALGEVGKVGVPISHVEDMAEVLEGIPLEDVSLSMTINSTAPILLAFLVCVAEERGLPLARLRGTLQNDMLKEFLARRTYRFPAAASLRLVVDVLEHSARELPSWNPISISGYHMREAGATAVQELGFTLSNALEYLQRARARGLPLDAIARRVSFFWSAHNHLFEEVAKLRAARRLWASLLRERFGLTDPDCARMRFHTQTAGSTLTAREPESNAVRVTIQALAAILGGTQSLHTNAVDEALGLPTQATARLALRTQQVLAFESGVADVADPLGGAPAIEALTDELAARARDLIARVDAMGGALRAIERGYPQAAIEESSYAHQREVEEGRAVVVGVNAFTEDDGAPLLAPSAAPGPSAVGSTAEPPGAAKGREETLARWKAARRDPSRIRAAREGLAGAAASDVNLMPCFLRCARERVTLGEMMETLAGVYGEYRE